MVLDKSIFIEEDPRAISEDVKSKARLEAQEIITACEIPDDKLDEVENEEDLTHEQELARWESNLEFMVP